MIEINIFVRIFRLFLRNMCFLGMFFVDEVYNLKVYSVVIFVLFKKKKICEKRMLCYIDNWNLFLV